MKIYDEFMGWPYHEPYGMVTAPKVKKPRKPRKSRAMPAWLKEQKKAERAAKKKPRKRTHRPRITPLVESPYPLKGFAETFAFFAKREPIDMSEYRVYNPEDDT